jgi:predicted porin
MNKKLLAVAVAGALAVPGVAFAQASAVTISGIFKLGFDSIKNDNATSTGTPVGNAGRLNNQQLRVTDNSSRLIFSVNESLGNGLSAIGQLDVRFAPNNANANFGGNSFVGFKSTKWGQLTLGRNDLHYGAAPDDTAAKAGALQGAAISLFDYIQLPGINVAATGVSTAAGVVPATGLINAVNIPIANATRTPSVVKYDTPSFSGFTATVAYSANPIGAAQPSDMSVVGDTATRDALITAGTRSTRNGYAWNVRPEYNNGPLKLGYSYWVAKPDAPLVPASITNGSGGNGSNTAAVAGFLDQRGDSLYGSYQFGGFKAGLGWNRSRVNASTSNVPALLGSGGRVAERDAWSIPMSYVMGPHNFVGHYTKANNIKSDVVGAVTSGTGAYMYSLAYVYDFSARTSVGLTFSQIHNDRYSNYTYFTGNGTLGSPDATPVAGERQNLIHLGMKHAF